MVRPSRTAESTSPMVAAVVGLTLVLVGVVVAALLFAPSRADAQDLVAATPFGTQVAHPSSPPTSQSPTANPAPSAAGIAEASGTVTTRSRPVRTVQPAPAAPLAPSATTDSAPGVSAPGAALAAAPGAPAAPSAQVPSPKSAAPKQAAPKPAATKTPGGAAGSSLILGQDMSWPQCPVGMGRGHGKPIPGTVFGGMAFSVIGVTEGGYAFNRNPCVSSLVGYARAHYHRVAPYMVPVFPNASQLATYGDTGPRSGTGRAGRLFNVGHAEGVFAARAARDAGIPARFMWVDVEPVPFQDWKHTRAAQAENRLVIEGVLAGLKSQGMSAGFYSYTYGWKEITGGWRRPEPVWSTVATRGRAAALATCTKPSFSGGPVVLAQWYDHTHDFDLVCPSARAAIDRYFVRPS